MSDAILRLDTVAETGGVQLPVAFDFDPALPMRVTVTFTTPSGTAVPWVMERGLFSWGIAAPADDHAGIGDMRIWRCGWRAHGHVHLWLRDGDTGMAAEFAVPIGPVARWLADTYAAVAADAEDELARAALDAELARILEGAA